MAGVSPGKQLWTAPVLWRFDRTRETHRGRITAMTRSTLVAKAVEDYRGPRRVARNNAATKSARSWTAPVLWRFDRTRETHRGRITAMTRSTLVAKAVEDYRGPRRVARNNAATKSARSWTAPVLWRSDRTRETHRGRITAMTRSTLVAKAVEDYRSPRRVARDDVATKSARSWTAPVLWRFDRTRETHRGRNTTVTRSTLVAKAVEDYRSPKRVARNNAANQHLGNGRERGSCS